MEIIRRQSGIILFLIVFLGFILRIYQVNQIPPSLSWDEVSIGYNAYSILKTGMDEHGRFLPYDTFVGYGDYKPPLPVYLTVPFVAAFGLNEFSVRLPSVIAGTLAILFTYFLVLELFHKGDKRNREVVALLSALLLAVSPWHVQLSRAGWEANIATSFIMLGAWLALSAREHKERLYLAWLPFVAAIYTFNSARYFVPMLGVILLFFGWKEYRLHIKELALGIIIALLLAFPIIPHILSPEARLRFTEVNIFSDSSIVAQSNIRIAADDGAWWSKILHNRRVGYARSYLTHFFDQFEPWFLFVRGDGNPKFSLQDTGQLYLIELPFLVIGVIVLFSQVPAAASLLVLWLVSAIVPAATARETPHALRVENTLPVWQIFISIGIVSMVRRLWSGKWKKIVIYTIMALYIFNVSYFLHSYFVHYSREYSGEWQYGYREAIRFVQPIQNNYDRVYITEAIGRAYMYTLFYEQYDPKTFIAGRDSRFDAEGFYHVYGFDRFRFVEGIDMTFNGKALYVMEPAKVPKEAHVLSTVNLLNGEPVLKVFEL